MRRFNHKVEPDVDLTEVFPDHSEFVEALISRLRNPTRRTRHLMMRMSPTEHDALKSAARDAGVSIADVIRYALGLCLSNGSLDEVAKQHLATLSRSSIANRDDVTSRNKQDRFDRERALYEGMTGELTEPSISRDDFFADEVIED